MTEPHRKPEYVGLVLAAGSGQRFGSDKRLAQLPCPAGRRQQPFARDVVARERSLQRCSSRIKG